MYVPVERGLRLQRIRELEPLMPERYFRFMSHFSVRRWPLFYGRRLPKTQIRFCQCLSGLNYLLRSIIGGIRLIGTGAAGVREVFRHPTQRIKFMPWMPCSKSLPPASVRSCQSFVIYDRITSVTRCRPQL